MKNKITFLFLFIMFFSCRKPIDPILNEDQLSFHHWGTFDVGGDCLDLDISDSVLVAAANYNGFFVFSVDAQNQSLDTLYHGTDLDPTAGDNRVEQILYSSMHDLVFAVDRYDKIWIHKLNGTPYLDNWVEDCYNGVWLSTAIDERDEEINIISLVKHNAAQADTGGTVGEYDQYSTSIVWKNLTDINPDDVFTNSGVPACEYTYNFSILPTEIYFSGGLLSVSNGELGVNILKQIDENICIDENGTVIEEFVPTGSYNDDREYCTTPPSPGPWIPEDGLGGEFEPAGGFIPSIFSSFDTPGEVKTVYSFENTIFAGLSTSNGCVMQSIGEQGELINNFSIAEGYSVYGVHYDNELLALACGHDGILIYEWGGNGVPLFLGKISTSYANKIKVNNNRVFVATEDGIDIFEIER